MKISHRDEIDSQKRNSATVSSQRPSEYGPADAGKKAEGDKTLSAFLFSCEQEARISLRFPAFNLRAVLGGLCNVRVLGMCAAHSLETSEDLPHFPFFTMGGVGGLWNVLRMCPGAWQYKEGR